MTRRGILVGFGLLALATAAASEPPTGSAPPPPPAPEVPPRGVRAVEVRIAASQRKLESLVTLARDKTKLQMMVRAYRLYSADQLANEKKEVTFEKLWEQVLSVPTSAEVPEELRREAAEALVRNPNALDVDPDLKMEGKGLRRKRALWSSRTLLKGITARDDRTQRELSHRLLLHFFPPMANDPDILKYDPDESKSKTWPEAKKRWDRYLQR